MGPPFFGKAESYDHACSIDRSFFEKCWREADRLLRFLNKYYCLALYVSTLLFTTANFFVVNSFAYTELQAFPSCAT